MAAQENVDDGFEITASSVAGGGTYSLSALRASVTGGAVSMGLWGASPVIRPAGAAQVAPAAYVTGAFGLDTNVKMQALFDLVVAMRLALVNTGIMKGAA